MSRRYAFRTLDVFTARRFGGNQLAVFPEARGITSAEMQALATEFNYSETTFVLPPEDPANTARVRIFNRTQEMPFAGHPNVGTATVLAELGRDVAGKLRLEQIAGIVAVDVLRDGQGRVARCTIGAPQSLKLGPTLPAASAAPCASIAPEGVVTARHLPTIAADGGNPRLLLEVTPETLSAAAPDAAAFHRTLAAHPELNGRLSLYLYTRQGTQVRARMFSPLMGTPEDAATGSAATPLAGFLLHLDGAEHLAIEITQGVEMGRPSTLHAEARRTPEGIRARVGGACVPVLWGEAVLD